MYCWKNRTIKYQKSEIFTKKRLKNKNPYLKKHPTFSAKDNGS